MVVEVSLLGVDLMKNREMMPKPFRKNMTPFIIGMLLIPILWFIIFYLVVNVNSILMAFKYITGVDDNGRIIYSWGLENYRKMFNAFSSPGYSELRVSLINTLKYFFLNLLIIIPLTYFVAYFLYKRIRGYKFFRVLFYLPSIISGVAMVIIFKNMITTYGPIYMLLKKLFNYEMPPLLTNAKYATNTIMVYCVWVGFGVNTVLYQGAMGRIPIEVIEAGKLEGIKWWQELWYVVTPMVWPTLSTTLILAITQLFVTSGPILLFDTGGAFETSTIAYWIYKNVDSGVYEYPASVGFFFTLVSIPIVFSFRWLVNKIDPDVEY